MTHAYILAVFRNSEQVIRLYERLNDKNTVFVIHICLNSTNEFTKNIKSYFKSKSNVIFCKRERATVFRFGIVDGVMNAIEALIENNIHYDYITSLSGQDYPIKPNNIINDFLINNQGKEFITYHPIIFGQEEDYEKTLWKRKETYRFEDYWIKFTKKGPLYRFPSNRFKNRPLWNIIKVYLYEFPIYLKEKKVIQEATEIVFSRIYTKKKNFIEGFEPFGGWAWWTLTFDCSKFMLETYRKNPQLKKFFKFSWTPDEMVYQTIIMNSPFKSAVVNDDLREIIFPGNGKEGSHPLIYGINDFEYLNNSPKLFARKLDLNIDKEIFNLIDKEILENTSHY